MDTATDLTWILYVELRKEILEAQQLRARAIGLKITLVGGAIALILANRLAVDDRLLVVPALAAMFFDLLINSHSITIKRIGTYNRLYLEPELRRLAQWPSTRPLWEEFMATRALPQRSAMVGNLGITFLVALPAVVILFGRPITISTVLLTIILILMFVFVVRNYLRINKYVFSPAADANK